MNSTSSNSDLVYVYILAPITVIVAVGVITYITVQSRRLRKEMIESGQLVGIMPAVITINSAQGPFQQPPRQEIRSPDGLPPPPPYSR